MNEMSQRRKGKENNMSRITTTRKTVIEQEEQGKNRAEE